VFPCGITLDKDGDGFNLYYGGGDSCIALAHGRVSALLEWLAENGRPNGAGE